MSFILFHFMIVHKTSRDIQYAILADLSEEAAGNVVHYLFDRETLELTEIEQDAQGAFYFALNDGTIVLRNDNELYVYDPESNEASLLYDLNLEDNQSLSKYAVSSDGHTIAYAYVTETEDKDGKTEEQTSITIMRR